MLVQQLPSGDVVARLGSVRDRPSVTSTRALREARTPAASAPPKHLVFGAVTISVHEHDAGSDRASGVAAGRLRLFLVRGGSVEIPTRDGRQVIRDGQGIVVTGTASVRMSSSSSGEVIGIGMPLDEIPQFSLPRNAAIPIEDAALLRPIGAFVHTLHGDDEIDVLSRGRFSQILRDMLLVVIRRATVGAGPGTVPSIHQRAAAILRQRHADAGLSPAEVAAEVNVSLRQLEREFQSSGRTIRQEIRRIRVAAAVALLQEEGRPPQTIDAIAVQVGLSNGSSLARAMAAENLPSPARLRAAARSGLPGRCHT